MCIHRYPEPLGRPMVDQLCRQSATRGLCKYPVKCQSLNYPVTSDPCVNPGRQADEILTRRCLLSQERAIDARSIGNQATAAVRVGCMSSFGVFQTQVSRYLAVTRWVFPSSFRTPVLLQPRQRLIYLPACGARPIRQQLGRD